MADRNDDVLTQAIERNLAAVLSLPSAGMFRHYKTRFLHNCPEGIWIDGVTKEHLLIDSLIESGQPTGISFRSGPQKVNFAVPILKRDPQHQVNATTTVQALLIARPQDVKAIQRRTHYRAPVHEVDQITIELWRVNEQDAIDKPMPKAAQVKATIHNLSVGGMGVLLTTDGTGPKLVAGQKLRILLCKAGEDKILVEGRCTSPRTNDSGRVEAGIQFIGLQDRHEGRQVLSSLTRLVGVLQREEVKRMRRSA
jgi:c-di-GMP-binding flagellar brake protein YcgR